MNDVETIKAILGYIDEPFEIESLLFQSNGQFQVRNDKDMTYYGVIFFPQKQNEATVTLQAYNQYFLKEVQHTIFEKRTIRSHFFALDEKHILEQTSHYTITREFTADDKQPNKTVLESATNQTQFYDLPEDFLLQEDLKRDVMKPYVHPRQMIKRKEY